MGQDAEFRSDLAAALLIEKIVRETYASARSKEIQPLQWSILRYVGRSTEQECTMIRIAAYLGLTHAPVVRAIKTLVKRGLIDQKPNPFDARSHVLSLTELGYEKLATDPILGVVERIQRLPEGEREVFKRLIRSLSITPEQNEIGGNEKTSRRR